MGYEERLKKEVVYGKDVRKRLRKKAKKKSI